MREVVGNVVGYAMLAPFAHVAVAITLAPLLFFTKQENRTFRGVLVGSSLCIVWWGMCLGAIEFTQFTQSPAVIGLALGAAGNVLFLWLRELRGDKRELNTALVWLAVYLSPALGYGVGSLFS